MALRFSGLPRLDSGLAHNLRCDMLAGVMGSLYTTVPASFAGVIARRLGAEPLDLGIFWAVAFYGMFVALFSGMWMPKGRLLSYAVLVGIVGRALLAPAPLVEDPLLFLIVVAVSWSSVDIVGAVLSDITRRIYPLRQRGQLIALVRMAAVVSGIAAAPAAGVVLDRFGPRLLFPLAAGIGVAGWLIYSRIRVPAGEAETQPNFTPRRLFSVFREDPRVVRWLIGIFVFGTGLNAVWPLFSVLLVDRYHASYTQVGLLATVAALASLVSYVPWGRLSDLRSPFTVYAFALASYAVVPLGYLLCPSVEWLLGVAVLNGVAIAGTDVVSINAFSRLPPEGQFVRYQVAVGSVLAIRGAAAGLIGSLLYEAPWFGPGPLLAGAALLCVVGGLIISTIRVERDPAPAP